MKKFGIQLWSVRDFLETEKDVKETFKKLGEMGYTEAQTAGLYPFISVEKFAEYAHDAGISFCGTHYDYDLMKNDIKGSVAYHKVLGTTNIGIGGASGCFGTKESTIAFAREYNELAKIYGEYGFRVSYHNHSIEGRKFDGKTIMDILIEEFTEDNIFFCLDSYWLQHAGFDVCSMLERLSGKVDIFHLKDMAAWREYPGADGKTIYAPGMTEVGTGNLDFKKIIATAEKCGTQHFIVEDEYYTTGNSLESVKISADNVKARFLEK